MSSSRISTRPSRNPPFATGATLSTTSTVPELITTMTQRNAGSASVAASRVPHRVTVRKTAYQVGKLQEMWAQTHTPTKEQREQIAEEIGLETRIVSTWFRDERSKETRARAEKQRMERGTVGPVRNTRTSTALLSSRREDNMIVDAGSDEDEITSTTVNVPQQAPSLDRHSSPIAALPVAQPQSRASPRSRYAPYPVSHSVDLTASNVAKKLPSQRHFDPLIRASVPIDFHHQPDHDQLTDDAASESYGYPSPIAYPRQSLPPAPSMSSSSSETSEDDEDELEEDDEDNMVHGEYLRPHEFSPKTPALIPSTIPSPRVFQPSTSPNSLPPISTLGPSSPSNFISSSPLHKPVPSLTSPYNLPITLPTQSGGTYTFKPLPVIVGPLPRRDSTWRFNYYDKVSNVRQTLGNKLHHDGSSSSSLYRSPHHDDESDGDSASEDGITASSPAGRSSAGGILSGLGGLFGGGKKQLFASN